MQTTFPILLLVLALPVAAPAQQSPADRELADDRALVGLLLVDPPGEARVINQHGPDWAPADDAARRRLRLHIGMRDGVFGDEPVEWTFVARDGADLPPAQVRTRPADLPFVDVGTTLDLLWTPVEPGERTLRIVTTFDQGLAAFPREAPPPDTMDIPVRVLPGGQDGYVDAGGGVQLYYRMVGTGPDTVVVLHGGPGFTMDYLAADLEPLAERHTLLFYDQRGAGRSSLVTDSAALDAQRFAEDLEAVRTHFGLERLNLLGHSWGAAVAALYAARFPERVGRLLIVGGVPLRRSEHVEAFERFERSRDAGERRLLQELREARLADPGDADACRAYYVVWFRPFFAVGDAADRSRGDFCAGTPESRTNKIRSVDRFTAASLGDWDFRPALRGLDAPALVIHGTVDPLPFDSAREWAVLLPNGRFLPLEGIGHFPYLEAPETFFPAVDEFLQGRWPAGSEAVP